MDPTKCLEELIDCARAGDHEGMMDKAEDLADWLRGGGFSPKGRAGV